MIPLTSWFGCPSLDSSRDPLFRGPPDNIVGECPLGGPKQQKSEGGRLILLRLFFEG